MSFHLASRKIIKDWTDYNEHMNMAYYVLIFDEAWETMLNKFDMGGAKAQINKRSTMVVETRTTYDNEVKENEEVDVYCTFFDHDKKRLHLKCEMIEKKQENLLQLQKVYLFILILKKEKLQNLKKIK
jgi:acyl-CoA thioester hydrolase